MKNKKHLHKTFSCQCAEHATSGSFTCEEAEEVDADLTILQKMRTLADNPVCVDRESPIFNVKPTEP